MASDSVFEVKKGFILSQIRVLSQSIAPSPEWQEGCPQTEEGDLTNSAVDGALQKVNQLARRHQQLIYSSMAVDHVAEQLDALYWQHGSASDGIHEREVLSGRFNLTDPQNIELLPDSWPDEAEGSNEQQEQYQKLVGELSTMATGLTSIHKRHAQLVALKKSLEPLANPKQNVQPNLVTRDGELAAELNKMRILAAKLANTVESSKGQLRRANVQQIRSMDLDTRVIGSESLMEMHGL